MATNIVTHVQRMVAVAIWRLARHVASAVPAAVAAAASPAPTRNTLEAWEAASCKAAVGCLTRGTEDLTGGGSAALLLPPLSVCTAACTGIAAARVATQHQEGHLFPLPSVDQVAHSWWRYLPFLIAVLRRGVDKLYALVPGTSVALYWYGTVSLAMLARIVKRLLPTDAALVGDVAEYGAAAIEKRVRGGPIGSRSSTVGSDMRADNAG